MIQGERNQEGMIPEGMAPEGMTPEGMTLGGLNQEGRTRGGMNPERMTLGERTRGEMMQAGIVPGGVTLKGIKAEKSGRVHLQGTKYSLDPDNGISTIYSEGSRERTVGSVRAEIER